ncbi:MAG: proteasome subunit alpha [Verrucomicrobiota bacterium]
MIGEEPYRWLEAIQNRREYIEDQLRPAKPVFAVAGGPGILLCAVSASPKLFEVYDHLALAGLGHPADLERVRQSAIDAAHVEGFTRSRADVGARRLANYTLAPAMKAAFEQIFAAPLLFRGVLAELGETPAEDSAWTLDYDGSFEAAAPEELARGLLLSGRNRVNQGWTELADKPAAGDTLKALAGHALRALAWAQASGDGSPRAAWKDLPKTNAEALKILGTPPAFALLDRARRNRIAYRVPGAAELGLSPGKRKTAGK